MSIEAKRFELSLWASREKKSKWHAAMGEACRKLRVLRIEADCQRVPVDLVKLANYLGICSIRAEPLAMKARLLREGSGLAIEVNSELTGFQRRFSVAHELAHVIVEGQELRRTLSRLEKTKQGGMHSIGFTEKLCDAVATEILLPADWLRGRVMSVPPSIECVVEIAAESETSIEAVADRIVELGYWNCSFLWWDIDRGYFRAARSSPFLSEDFLCFVKPRNQRMTVLREAREKGKVIVGHDVILFRREPSKGRIQCLRLGETRLLSLIERAPN